MYIDQTNKQTNRNHHSLFVPNKLIIEVVGTHIYMWRCRTGFLGDASLTYVYRAHVQVAFETGHGADVCMHESKCVYSPRDEIESGVRWKMSWAGLD